MPPYLPSVVSKNIRHLKDRFMFDFKALYLRFININLFRCLHQKIDIYESISLFPKRRIGHHITNAKIYMSQMSITSEIFVTSYYFLLLHFYGQNKTTIYMQFNKTIIDFMHILVYCHNLEQNINKCVCSEQKNVQFNSNFGSQNYLI